MTATDELHRLLTEAGVEYQFNDATKIFEWHYDGTDGEGIAHATEAQGGINIIACSLTPEQAIAATLGPRSDSCNCTNGERTNLAVTLGDADATQARRDVAADVDEIIEHVINANMLSMPYDVYSELFDAVDGLGVKIENLQSENAKLRELCAKALVVMENNCSECAY